MEVTTEKPTETEASTTAPEETVAQEINDILPAGPAEAAFTTDNMNFYMEGEAFTLPMSYSDFLKKATAKGFAITKDTQFNKETKYGSCVLYKMKFDRAVEGQDKPESFDIMIVNSTDTNKSVDLKDASSQVVGFEISMYAGAIDAYDPDKGIWATNINTDVYLTPEIGLGRNIDNLYNAWGGSMNEMNGIWDWKSDKFGNSSVSYSAPTVSIRSVKRAKEYKLYSALEEAYGESKSTENIINYINLYNNPYIK